MAGLKEFFEKLASDTELQEKVKAAGNDDALLKVITDAGYDVKLEELKKSSEKTVKGVELSDGDLENVAGGMSDAEILTRQFIVDIERGKISGSDIEQRLWELCYAGNLDEFIFLKQARAFLSESQCNSLLDCKREISRRMKSSV